MQTIKRFFPARFVVGQAVMEVILILMFLSAVLPACAQEDDLEVLRKLNARFIHNYVTNDVASHDQILHSRFVCITSQGAWVDREAYLKAWATGFDPNVVVYWDYRDEKIAVIGSIALVRSVNRYTIVVNGKTSTGMSQYADTYVKENGLWKCVQAQITNVSPENYPPDTTIVRKYVNGK